MGHAKPSGHESRRIISQIYVSRKIKSANHASRGFHFTTPSPLIAIYSINCLQDFSVVLCLSMSNGTRPISICVIRMPILGHHLEKTQDNFGHATRRHRSLVAGTMSLGHAAGQVNVTK